MCAIAGSFDESDTKQMISLMRYRGPDDIGFSTEDGFTLGMARLSIIDTYSKGLCPIKYENYTLTFNGELYNYIELKKELVEKGFEFSTNSDSEVLLKSYVAWGVDALQKFNWMGAFAIQHNGDLFFARDIAGEKPLYFRRDGEDDKGNRQYFRFASEAKALGWDCEEFPPAHYGVYSLRTKKLDIRPWWTIPNTRRSITLDRAIDELDELLADSVKLRTRSDVQYGLYYSGGIDSTLIGTYHNFPTLFTYQDKAHTSEEFKFAFPKILWHLDYPVKTFSPFGLWKLAEQARAQEVKVVLSGEGADELFGGYVRFVPNEFNRRAREVFPSYRGLFPYRDMLTEEFNGNMRELLRMGDRMAAAHGVENRCPFLDRRIIEFAMTLPMELKINGFDTKVVLRELIKRRLPSYKFEEKKGLFCSVNKWLGVPEEGFGKETYVQFQKELWNKLTEK